jgi:hypothetical protein
MHIDQLRGALQAAPFRPFILRMADGRFFPIRHPDFVAVGPAGRTVIVIEPNDAFQILDTLLMTEVNVPAPTAPSS